jgi:acetolactate synthase-1/3 small subunit
MRHTISVLVRNEFGVLSRVSGMFSGRGYNIDSLNVAPTLDARISHMTLVTHGDDETIEQITKQLHKLIDVITVVDFVDVPFVARELAMLKVEPTPSQRAEVLRISEIFRGKILGLRQLVRTGPLALRRG